MSARPQSRKPAVRAINRYLLPFVVLFAMAQVSGLFYFLVPRSWNWRVSQTALWVHLIAGVASFFFLAPYVLVHAKEKKEEVFNLIFLWRAIRRQNDETDWSYQQRIFGHILNWIMVLLALSGLLLALPGVLWLGGVVWLAGYPAYQIANLAHLGLAMFALALIGLHIARKRKRTNRR